MRYRILGKTDLKVSILGFGGISIMRVSEKKAVDVVNRALDLGVNFVHTSVTYGDSAYKIGQVMKERRDECFLAVKVGGRTEKEAEERLKKSLEALNTDKVEIVELPVNAAAFPEVMGLGGAYKAFEKAKLIKSQPTVIIARTTKGKGVSFMENVVDFHGIAPMADELELALKELE